MARPHKEGIDYFPLVIKFEDKIDLLTAEFGACAVGIIVCLYQKIYANGYYIEWDDDVMMLFSRYVNEDRARVKELLERSMERGVFDERQYEKYSILTSHGIQKQYLKVCKECRRKKVTFIREYCLVSDPELLEIITEMIVLDPEQAVCHENTGEQAAATTAALTLVVADKKSSASEQNILGVEVSENPEAQIMETENEQAGMTSAQSLQQMPGEINTALTQFILEETGVSPDESTQSKVKKSKVKKNTKSPCPEPAVPDGTKGRNPKEELVFNKGSPALEAALYLRGKIQANNPRARVPTAEAQDSLLQKWALEMDRLNRLGPVGAEGSQGKGYSWQEIKEIINWCQDDEFWSVNILSPGKLREQIVQLENKLRRSTKHAKTGFCTGPANQPQARDGSAKDMAGKYRKFVR